MIDLLVLLFPLVLMAFMLLLERVEERLRHRPDDRQVEEFLDNARPDDVDVMARLGVAQALERWRTGRHRITRLLPSRAGRDA